MLPRLVLCSAAVLLLVDGVNVTIDNALPRRDAAGAIIDAHDASVQKFPLEAGAGTDFWMHTGAYGAPGLLQCTPLDSAPHL
jgi:hypothetical protein